MIGWIGGASFATSRRHRILVTAAFLALLALAMLAIVAFGLRTQSFLRFTAAGSFSVNGEYPSTNLSAIHGIRYGSWTGDDHNVGTLTSEPFTAPFRIAFMIAGYPNHRGEHLELVRANDPRTRIDVRVAAAPQEHWQQRFFIIPPSWRGQRVVFVATDAGRGWGDWIGIADVNADVRPANPMVAIAEAFAAFAGDAGVRLLGLTAVALLLVVPVIGAAATTCRRLDLPTSLIYAMSWLVLGAAAEFTFFMTMVNRHAAYALVIVGAAGGTWLTVRKLRDAASAHVFKSVDVWGPFALTAFVSMTYAALLGLGVAGNGAITAETEAWLGLPTDNILPHILALNIAAHLPPKPFVGDWLSSDRPPLQAGFDLLLAALTPFVKDSDTRYQGIAIVLQVAIFGALFTLCQLVGLSKLRSVGVVLLCSISGFFFLNSIFVWPKLLAAAYGAFGLAFVIARDPRRSSRAVFVGASTGLGLLSHGGLVFTLPVLVIAWLRRDGRAALRPLLVALLTIVAVIAPWTWYQKAYDPPGDRLLKWHLAGHQSISSETFPSLLVHAYTRIDPLTIVSNKIANIRTIMPIDVSIPLQQRQFYYLRYGLSALVIPYLAALLFLRSRRLTLRWAGVFAWIALGSNLFWCLAMYGPATTVIHQGSYLTVALMFLAGGIVATEWIPVYVVVLVAQTAIFVAAWLPKFDIGAAATPGGICAVVVLIGLAILALELLWRPVAARLRHVRLPDRLDNDKRRFPIWQHKELLTLGIVALVLFVLSYIARSSLALLLIR